MLRRQLCIALAGLAGAALAAPARALMAGAVGADVGPRLTPAQSRVFREWLLCIVHAQLEQGPTPRWQQRDCAGLVRFAVAEALREHDGKWQRAMGLAGRRLPAPLALGPEFRQLRHNWQRADGGRAAWVGALELVQGNTRLVSRDPLTAQAGDLFFFDQGDEQHLMIWMGRYLAYHTGRVAEGDTGLRAYSLEQMMVWRDTRWKPHADNPNFAGVYRLNFVA